MRTVPEKSPGKSVSLFEAFCTISGSPGYRSAFKCLWWNISKLIRGSENDEEVPDYTEVNWLEALHPSKNAVGTNPEGGAGLSPHEQPICELALCESDAGAPAASGVLSPV